MQLPPGIWYKACSHTEINKLRLKVLRMSEFVMLTEYDECMVPLMYLFWVWNSILSPNRAYWVRLTENDISFEQAIKVTYLLLLALLRFISLIMLMMVLQFKCDMPVTCQ